MKLLQIATSDVLEKATNNPIPTWLMIVIFLLAGSSSYIFPWFIKVLRLNVTAKNGKEKLISEKKTALMEQENAHLKNKITELEQEIKDLKQKIQELNLQLEKVSEKMSGMMQQLGEATGALKIVEEYFLQKQNPL